MIGFLDRIVDGLTGMGNSLYAPIGFLKDIALSPTDNRGMVDGIYHDFTNRLGELVGGAVGPTGVGGSLIGALPSPIRGGANELIKPVQSGMDTAYTDLVGRPISTVLSAGQIATTQGTIGQRIAKITNPDTWAQSWDISAHRTPGQAAALGFMTKDILNPNQVRKAQGSDFYSAASGLMDAGLHWYADPTQVIGGSAAEYMKNLHTIDGEAAIAKFTQNGAMDRLTNDIMDRAAAVSPAAEPAAQTAATVGETAPGVVAAATAAHPNIDQDALAGNLRDTYFPNALHNPLGAQHAAILAQAAAQGGAPLVENSLRILMGATDEIQKLWDTQPVLAAEVERLMQQRENVSRMSTEGWLLNNTADDIAKQDLEYQHALNQQELSNRLDAFKGTMQVMPHQSIINQAREAVTHSDWYQTGLLGKPLQVVFNAHPAHLVQFDDANSDATVMQYMKSSDLPLERQTALRGEFLNAGTKGERVAATNKIVAESLQSIADSTNLLRPRNFDKWVGNIPGNTLDDTGKAELSAQYRAAVGRDAKVALVNQISNDHALPLPGFTTDELQQELAQALQKRNMAAQVQGTRLYDGAGGSVLKMEDENGIGVQIHTAEQPIWESQLADQGVLPDLKQYRSLTTKMGQFRAEHPYTAIPGHIAEGYYDFWKPANLIKGGTTFRVVTDGGLRVASKIGGLVSGGLMGSGLKDAARDGASAILSKVGIDLAKSSRGVGEQLVNGHTLESVFGLSPDDGARTYKFLVKGGRHMGQTIATAERGFYDRAVAGGDWKHYVSTDPGYEGAWVRDANLQIGSSALARHILQTKLQGAPSFRIADYFNGDTLNDAGRALVNHDPEEIATLEQMWASSKAALSAGKFDTAGSRLATRLQMAGAPTISEGVRHADPVGEATKWLRSTTEGQAVAREMGYSPEMYQQWAQRGADQIDRYLPTDALKQAALEQKANPDLLHAEFEAHPDQFVGNALPVVHGEILKQDLATGPIMSVLKNARDKLYEALFSAPDSYLVRNPYMDHVYNAEIRRQIQLLTGEREFDYAQRMERRAQGLSETSAGPGLQLTQKDIEQIQYSARQYALAQTKGLLHDYAERSELGHMMRFISPFYSPWQQMFTRWAGVTVDNPAFVRRLDQLWMSPEKAGVVTDGKGNVLDENDNIRTSVEPDLYKVGSAAADNQRRITLSLPKWAEDVPGIGKALQATGDKVRFGKDTLNLLLHGLPTVGPLVQVPLNEVAKSRPELADSLKWALPYGPTQNTLDLLKPTLVKHLQQESEGDANRSYAYTVLQIFNDDVVNYNLGKTHVKPTYQDAEQKAQQFWHVRTLAGVTLPITPQFTSPYQHYIDAYHARLAYDGTLTPVQKRDPNYLDPKQWFLKQFGEEFFPLTNSMSKSVDGIPPTLAGSQFRDEHQALINKYPELGGLFVGQLGAGAFSSAVYNSQFDNQVGVGGPTERGVQSQKDFAQAPSIELGWMKFSQAMHQIDMLRIQRQMPSLNVKGAEDLKAMKQNLVWNLSQQYPQWYEAYNQTDNTKWDQRVQGMTEGVKVLGTDRPELAGLHEYLQGRADLVKVLDAAKSHNLGAKANAQLQAQWDTFTNNLVAHNPAFADLYYRWLQNDPVAITDITNLASAGTLEPAGVA